MRIKARLCRLRLLLRNGEAMEKDVISILETVDVVTGERTVLKEFI